MKIIVDKKTLTNDFSDVFNIDKDINDYVTSILGTIEINLKHETPDMYDICINGNIEKDKKDLDIFIELYNFVRDLFVLSIKNTKIDNINQENDFFKESMYEGGKKLLDYIQNNWENFEKNELKSYNNKEIVIDLAATYIESYFILNNKLSYDMGSFDNTIIKDIYGEVMGFSLFNALLYLKEPDNIYYDTIKNNKDKILNMINKAIDSNSFNILSADDRNQILYYIPTKDYYIIESDDEITIHFTRKPENTTYEYVTNILKEHIINKYNAINIKNISFIYFK